MGIFEAVILGVVQGLTEFLPVSSSGHLVLLQNVMGFDTVPLFFDTMLHLGTLIAVVAVLFKEIVEIFKHPIKNHMGMIIIAVIPAGIAGLFFGDYFEKAYTGGVLLAVSFLITAGLLVFSELAASNLQSKKPVTVKSALAIGFIQIVAILPGVSRSGATISGGLFCGVERNRLAKFSFLISIPLVLGSVITTGKDAMDVGLGDVSIAAIVIGTIAAAAAGFFAVKFMLAIIRRSKLYGFAIYVAALGAFLLLDQYVLHIVF